MNICSCAEYLQNNVNPILQELTSELINKRPINILRFINNWSNNLLKQKENIESNTLIDSNESFLESDGSIMDLETFKKSKKHLINRKKVSISAEVFGDYNKPSEFKPRFIKKLNNEIIKIKQIMNKSFMFNSLNSQEQDKVIGAMEIKEFKANDYIIKEGEDGGIIYLVESGVLDCYKNINDEEKYLKSYEYGESFGELSLLYNVPRQATIRAKTNTILYALDRNTFNNIVKYSTINKRDQYESFLKEVPLFSTLNKYEILKVVDCLKEKIYKRGELIINQGDNGNSFFIIVKGELLAVKINNNSNKKIVYEYKNEGYFGELSLLKNQPRACNIIVNSDEAIVIEFDRSAFNNLLGPLEELLKRNISMYDKFVQKSIIQ